MCLDAGPSGNETCAVSIFTEPDDFLEQMNEVPRSSAGSGDQHAPSRTPACAPLPCGEEVSIYSPIPRQHCPSSDSGTTTTTINNTSSAPHVQLLPYCRRCHYHSCVVLDVLAFPGMDNFEYIDDNQTDGFVAVKASPVAADGPLLDGDLQRPCPCNEETASVRVVGAVFIMREENHCVGRNEPSAPPAAYHHHRQQNTYSIISLAVLPRFQGKGLGRLLMNVAIKRIQQDAAAALGRPLLGSTEQHRPQAGTDHSDNRDVGRDDLGIVITLQVATHNIAAHRLYASLGFKTLGCIEQYYGKFGDAFVMRLVIV